MSNVSARVEARLKTCQDAVRERPYSHSVAAGWYVQDVPALALQAEEAQRKAETWELEWRDTQNRLNEMERYQVAAEQRLGEMEAALRRAERLLTRFLPDLDSSRLETMQLIDDLRALAPATPEEPT